MSSVDEPAELLIVANSRASIRCVAFNPLKSADFRVAVSRAVTFIDVVDVAGVVVAGIIVAAIIESITTTHSVLE